MADHEDLNDTIEDTKDIWEGLANDWGDEPVGGGAVMGAFAEYVVTERFALGAEFLRLSGTGGYDWWVLEYDEYASLYAQADVGFEVAGNLASIYGVYRLPLGDSPAVLRFGAGVGYLFGAECVLDYAALMEFEEGSGYGGRQDTTFVVQSDVETSGSGVAFHGLFGAEYQLTDQLLLLASASYRVARVDELTVDKTSTRVNGEPSSGLWDLEEGEPLRWYNGETGAYFSTTEGDEVGLDFGGLQFTVGLVYAF
ncbi:MAG: hypothetical protein KAW67_01425 [Candidatus Eisenbacteria sp.]|nr:hypothetical protein [Candidatus Eisenbacteria bacterium]